MRPITVDVYDLHLEHAEGVATGECHHATHHLWGVGDKLTLKSEATGDLLGEIEFVGDRHVRVTFCASDYVVASWLRKELNRRAG